MYLKAGDNYKGILFITGLVTLAVTVIIFYSPPAIYPDPSYGFQVMHSMERGGGFNLAIGPSEENIAENSIDFLTWWTPGQYLLPYFFKIVFGFNLGRATVITILFCNLVGLSGFFLLFRKLGFSKIISAVSIAFIASQEFYFLPYIFYNGGETLLFGFTGWFLYGCFSFQKINWKLLLFVLISGWAGFFCKSSFLWMYGAGLCCIWINISGHSKGFLTWIRNGIYISIPAIISLAFIYKYYLSRGLSPTSTLAGFHLSLDAISFPIASPLLSGFSIDEISNSLIYHFVGGGLGPELTSAILIALASLSIVIVWALNRSGTTFQYKLVLSFFYSVSILFFGYLFMKRAEVSLEARHFRIVGLLIIPGIIYLVSRFRTAYKSLVSLLFLSIICLSWKSIIMAFQNNHSLSAHGVSGFAQPFIDQPSLDSLQQMDNQYNNAIFVFKSPDLGVEIMHNRIITLSWGDADFNKDSVSYDGHAGPIFILVPSADTSVFNAYKIQNCFPEYSNFNMKNLSKDYVLFSGE